MSFESVQRVFSSFGKERKEKDRWAKGRKKKSVWGQIMGIP